MNVDPRLSKLIQKYQEVLGTMPPPLSCKKLVQMDLKLKPEFEGSVVRRRPYPVPQDQIDEIGTPDLGMHRCWPHQGG